MDKTPLIEVTGGFVGDLTARDNILLTAGLHGLTKKQIADRSAQSRSAEVRRWKDFCVAIIENGGSLDGLLEPYGGPADVWYAKRVAKRVAA